MYHHPRLSGVRKATIVKTKVGSTSLSVISARTEGVAFAPNANRVYPRISEPENRRSTIPDRPSPKFAHTRRVRKRVNFNPRRAFRAIKTCQMVYRPIAKCVKTRQRRSVRMHLSGTFSEIRNLARRNTTPRSTWKSKIGSRYTTLKTANVHSLESR
jgi:hypothetical protein